MTRFNSLLPRIFWTALIAGPVGALVFWRRDRVFAKDMLRNDFRLAPLYAVCDAVAPMLGKTRLSGAF